MTDGSLFNLSGLEHATPTQQSGDAGSLGQSQSLYRKYRPQTFAEDDLFGQEHVVNTLRNAIALNRIAHAYLFCGPRGTGKTTTARLLAKAVNCLDPDPYKRPCNVCASCVAINKGATTDVIEIDAASNRGIDDIRDLRERVKYAPTQLRTKFYIIDEAHQITGAAANAFLKTLEEPPAHTKFVLATTDPEELLQTIVSRCQRFDFRRINLEAMQACIRKVAGEESIAIDDEAVMAIARHATGSLRDALGLLDQLAVYREDDQDDRSRISLDLVRTVLGVSRNDRVEGIVRALADRDAAAGLQAIGGALDDGEDMRQLGRQLVSYIRMLLLQRAGGTDDADQTACDLAERFSLQEIAGLVTLFADIDYKVKHATLSQLPLELAIVEGTLRGQPSVAAPRRDAPALPPAATEPAPSRREIRDEWTPPEEQARSVDRPRTSLRDRVRGTPSAPAERQVRPTGGERAASMETTATSVTSPPPTERGSASARPAVAPAVSNGPVSSAPAAAAASEISFDTVIELWPKIKNDVKAVNRRIEALLQQIDPVAIVGDKLILVSAYEFHRNRVNADEARIVIEEVVGRLFKRRLAISAVTREEAQRLSEARRAASPTPEAAPSSSRPSRPVETPSRQDSHWEPPVYDDLPLEPPLEVQPDRHALPPASEKAGPAVASISPDSDEADREARRLQAAKNIFDAEEDAGA